MINYYKFLLNRAYSKINDERIYLELMDIAIKDLDINGQSISYMTTELSTMKETKFLGSIVHDKEIHSKKRYPGKFSRYL